MTVKKRAPIVFVKVEGNKDNPAGLVPVQELRRGHHGEPVFLSDLKKSLREVIGKRNRVPSTIPPPVGAADVDYTARNWLEMTHFNVFR